MSLILLHFLAAASLAASQDFLESAPSVNGVKLPRGSHARGFRSDPPFGEGGDGKDLPQLNYRYASFAVKDPEAAASFFERYSDATRLDASEYQVVPRPNAEVVGCRLSYVSGDFGSAYSDIYFINEPNLSQGLPQGSKGPTAFGKDVDSVHSMAQEDWDWFQDWHLAFSVDDIDPVVARLIRDGVPFVNRIAIYFAIPETGITIQLLGGGIIYWTEPFLFCRRTTDEIQGQFEPYAMNITTLDDALSRPIPKYVPSHQAMISAAASDCAEWIYRLFPVLHLDEKATPTQNHAYADGTCADIRWMSISPGGWEFHFVEQYVKRTGGLDVAAQEQMVKGLRGDFTQWDAYMHFRVGLKVDNLMAYKERFEAQHEPFYFEQATGQTGARMFVSMPNGYVAELFEEPLVGLSDVASEDPYMHRLAVVDDAVAQAAIAASLHESELGNLHPGIGAAMRTASRWSEV